ncbi:MAG: STAS domain-containing protein [Herpetosiphon sp.]
MALVKSQLANGVVVLGLQGRFDAHVTKPVADALEQAAREKPARVIVNLSDVHFADSSALATLVQGMKRCRQRDGDLYLCGLQQPVKIIFELTRLDRAFSIFPDEQAAINGFAA